MIEYSSIIIFITFISDFPFSNKKYKSQEFLFLSAFLIYFGVFRLGCPVLAIYSIINDGYFNGYIWTGGIAVAITITYFE